MPIQNNYLLPDWPAPANVRAYSSLRNNPTALPPEDECYQGFNLADHVGDEPSRVAAHRQQLATQLHLPAEPFWLQQTHSDIAIDLDAKLESNRADASYSRQRGKVCSVLTADCVPLLVCNRAGTLVAAIHAGWRGLDNQIIIKTIKQFNEKPENLLVWLGPAIGKDEYEIDMAVYNCFRQHGLNYSSAFNQIDVLHWFMNSYEVARIQLRSIGVHAIYGDEYCTYQQEELFYSFRRDGDTGRMASLIWLV